MAEYNVVLGLQSTADWSDPNYIPGDWREAILRYYPNGDAPLTAMLSKLPSEVTDHYRYDWWTEGLPAQGGAITDIYSDVTLGSAYVEGSGITGDVLYVKCAEAVAKEIRARHTVVLRDASKPFADCNGVVLESFLNGANSYIAVKLRENDDNESGHDFDNILVIGNSNPQASESPDAVSYQPVNEYNYCQIWRTPLEIAGTTLATKTRVGDWYQHEKSNTLRQHSVEIEKSIIWGNRWLGTGSNGKPEYTTGGLLRYITTNRYAYNTDTDYSGKTWVQGGNDWLKAKLTNIFKYGGDTRMAYAGAGAILAMSSLAEALGNVQIKVGQAEYGIKVTTFMFTFGEIHLKRHPLFSYNLTDWYSMVLFEPSRLRWRFMKGRDTHFRPDKRLQDGSWTDKDAIKEGWLTEGGCEFHIEPTFGYLTGVGQANTV